MPLSGNETGAPMGAVSDAGNAVVCANNTGAMPKPMTNTQ